LPREEEQMGSSPEYEGQRQNCAEFDSETESPSGYQCCAIPWVA
jgi:hypothetical protein